MNTGDAQMNPMRSVLLKHVLDTAVGAVKVGVDLLARGEIQQGLRFTPYPMPDPPYAADPVWAAKDMISLELLHGACTE